MDEDARRGIRVDGDGRPTIAVQVDGLEDGSTVVLLHGVGRSHRSWDFLVSELGSEHRLVRPDARGHGHSDRTSEGYLLDGYVADAVAVLEHVGGGPVVLVGHSLGGVVAAAVAQQRPELVAASLLIDPPLQLAEPVDQPPAGPLIDLFRRIQRLAPRWQEEGTAETALARELAGTPSPFGVPMGERYELDALAAGAHGCLHVDPAVFEPLLDPPPENLGPAVDIDAGLPGTTLVLAADLASPDRATSTSLEQRLVRSSEDLRWVRVVGGGHSLHEEKDHRGTAIAHLRGLLATTPSR